MRRIEWSHCETIGARSASEPFLDDVRASDTDDDARSRSWESGWRTGCLPSVEALDEERHLSEELRLLALLEQVAVVRALIDQVECLSLAPVVCAQLVQETACLGCRILEVAAELSRAVDAGPKSGILPLCSAEADPCLEA